MFKPDLLMTQLNGSLHKKKKEPNKIMQDPWTSGNGIFFPFVNPFVFMKFIKPLEYKKQIYSEFINEK